MSTRTNILITKGDTKIWLYRHCDGYPRATGYNLASCLAECGKMNGFLTLLLDQKDESTMYRPATPIYEFTTQMHGDIEYLYKINFDEGVSFMCLKRMDFKDVDQEDSWETLVNKKIDLVSRNTIMEALNFFSKEKLKVYA